MRVIALFYDSVENGLLYINYPMVEAYKHFNTILPDNGYKERKCSVADISGYKEFVGNETKYQDPRKINRIFLQQAVIHNVKKISYLMNEKYDLSLTEVLAICNNIEFNAIAKEQNSVSKGPCGYIHILCTCVLFISNYNKNLLLY